MKKVEHKQNRIDNLNELVTFSAWGVVLVLASFLCLFVGIWVDVALNTGPFFMIGLFVLAIFLVIARLYVEFGKTSRHLGNMTKHHA